MIHLHAFPPRLTGALDLQEILALFAVTIPAPHPSRFDQRTQRIVTGAAAQGRAEIHAAIREKTGDECALGREARAGTVAAKWRGHAGDHANFAAAVGITPAPSDFARVIRVGGFEGYRGVNPVDDLLAGNDLFHAPLVARTDVHEFDEAQDMTRAVESLGEFDEAMVVDAALDDAVDLDRFETRGLGGGDAFEHTFDREPFAIHAMKNLGVETVEADGHAAQAGFTQRLGPARQETTIGRDREVEIRVERSKAFDEFVKTVAEQRFTAGDPQLLDAVFEEEANEAFDLFEGEDLVARQERIAFAEDLGGHAIRAAEIAAVRHRNPQVAERSIELISQGDVRGQAVDLRWKVGIGVGEFDSLGIAAPVAAAILTDRYSILDCGLCISSPEKKRDFAVSSTSPSKAKPGHLSRSHKLRPMRGFLECIRPS